MDENGWIWFSKEWNLLLHGAMFSFQINLLEGRYRKIIRLPFGTIGFQPCDVLVSGVYLPSHHHIGQMKFSRIQWWKKSYCIPCFLYIYIYIHSLILTFLNPKYVEQHSCFDRNLCLEDERKLKSFHEGRSSSRNYPGQKLIHGFWTGLHLKKYVVAKNTQHQPPRLAGDISKTSSSTKRLWFKAVISWNHVTSWNLGEHSFGLRILPKFNINQVSFHFHHPFPSNFHDVVVCFDQGWS